MTQAYPLVMARDAFSRVEDNLRSLALAIEYLRGMERHGGAFMMDRAFTGFVALPSPGATSQPERPWRVVLNFTDDQVISREDVQKQYRVMARFAHPDHGGTVEAFAELTRARDAALYEIEGKSK